jgi:hypothetical protein
MDDCHKQIIMSNVEDMIAYLICNIFYKLSMKIICLAIATLFLIYMWNRLIMSNEYDIEKNITFLTQKKLGPCVTPH